MTQLKTIIVDDEWLIRSELKLLLERHQKISVVGEAGNISEAIQMIHDLEPDVIFLDIQMINENSFQDFQKNDHSFKTIFLSVFDEKFTTNNNINVIESLLKPIDEAKLCNVIEKL